MGREFIRDGLHYPASPLLVFSATQPVCFLNDPNSFHGLNGCISFYHGEGLGDEEFLWIFPLFGHRSQR